MNVQDAIKTKRAVRKFSERDVEDEVIQQILDAGRRSQSSKNTQPWQFIVVKNRDTLVKLSTTGDFAGHLAGANFAIIIVNLGGDVVWTNFDLGQAGAYFQLAAWELGVGSCIARIYQPDEARKILGVPDEYDCRVSISFGYPHEDFKPAKMGGRRSMDDVVRWEGW